MEQLLLVISVALMFFIRLGIPVVLLITVGFLVDRWQSRRENHVQQEIRSHT